MCQEQLNILENGPAYPFSDQDKLNELPEEPGVYTIWKGDRFLYVGMAKESLRKRLKSHASGHRGGDQFCIYVCDRLVLKNLTLEEICAVISGVLSLNKPTKKYIQQHLSYRFVEMEDKDSAHALELRILTDGLPGAGLPELNSS